MSVIKIDRASSKEFPKLGYIVIDPDTCRLENETGNWEFQFSPSIPSASQIILLSQSTFLFFLSPICEWYRGSSDALSSELWPNRWLNATRVASSNKFIGCLDHIHDHWQFHTSQTRRLTLSHGTSCQDQWNNRIVVVRLLIFLPASVNWRSINLIEIIFYFPVSLIQK